MGNFSDTSTTLSASHRVLKLQPFRSDSHQPQITAIETDKISEKKLE